MKSPLDRMPPFLCRVYAHVNLGGGRTRAMKVAEIARKARMSSRSVKRISRRTSWHRMREDMIFAFAEACGVNLMCPSRVIECLRKAKSRSHWRENEQFYARLFAEVKERLKAEPR